MGKPTRYLVAGFLLILGSLGRAQSLADLAKQEKERQARQQAAAGGPAKVYTSEVKSASSADGSGPTVATTNSSPAASPQGGSPAPAVPPTARPQTTPPIREASSRTVEVVMYMTPWCKYCQLARVFLSTQPKVTLTERNIEANKTYLSQMLLRSGGRNATPVLDVQGRIIVGFDAAGLSRAIADARRR